MDARLQIARAFEPLRKPARYKVFYGGRGGAKSWAYGLELISQSLQRPLRILCARELQISIADSVHKLLGDLISRLKLDPYFEITKTQIRSLNGSEFIFKGLRHNAQEIKSLEGVDICWVEEAQSVSRESWELLIPTIVFNTPFLRKRALRDSFPEHAHYNEKTAIHHLNYDPVIEVFTASKFQVIMESGKLFFRKARTGVSDQLLDMIDETRNVR